MARDTILGFGLTIFVLFLQYRLKDMPIAITTGGIALGVGLMAWPYLPFPAKYNAPLFIALLLLCAAISVVTWVFSIAKVPDTATQQLTSAPAINSSVPAHLAPQVSPPDSPPNDHAISRSIVPKTYPLALSAIVPEIFEENGSLKIHRLGLFGDNTGPDTLKIRTISGEAFIDGVLVGRLAAPGDWSTLSPTYGKALRVIFSPDISIPENAKIISFEMYLEYDTKPETAVRYAHQLYDFRILGLQPPHFDTSQRVDDDRRPDDANSEKHARLKSISITGTALSGENETAKGMLSSRNNMGAVTNNQGIVTQGQIGNNTLNVGSVPRDLDSAWGAPLKAQILREMPRDKPITVEAVMGDSEAIRLAHQLHAFLKANNFKLTEDGISQSVFSGPTNGLSVRDDRTTRSLIVGANLPR